MSDKDIMTILKELEPKLKSVLFQTNYVYREDLEQDLIERIISIIRNNKMHEVPSFFELIK